MHKNHRSLLQKTCIYVKSSGCEYDFSDVEPVSKKEIGQLMLHNTSEYSYLNGLLSRERGTAQRKELANWVVTNKLKQLIAIEQAADSKLEAHVKPTSNRYHPADPIAIEATNAQQAVNKLFEYRAYAVRYVMAENID